MRSVRSGFFVVAFLTALSLRAQSSVPTLVQAFPVRSFTPGGAAMAIDVRDHFSVPGVVGTKFAQFDTVFGRFNVELRDDAAPRHVANFLEYVRADAYANTFIHRAAVFGTGGVSIVQGGGYGYRLPFQVTEVPRRAPVALEYNLANARGTLAAARTSDVNSATSEWYFNTRDNSTTLDQSNGGGYSVFGRVMGTGMSVLDQIANLTRYNAGGAFGDIPLRNYTTGNPNETHLVVINSVKEATLFPSGSGPSVVELAVQNSAPAVVNATLTGSTLTLAAVGPGSATITVRATDTNGNTAEGTFTATVPAVAPVILQQPTSQTIAAGSTVVFSAPASSATSYRWERNGAQVAGATSGTLVIKNVTAAQAGDYVGIATNSIGTVRSETAKLTVVNLPVTDVGRLINLSILTTTGPGEKILTMGAVVRGGDAGNTLPVVIRGVGPTLAQPPFNVAGVLADPVMNFFVVGNDTAIDSNDNWGGSAPLAAAFQSVGAFSLPTASLDAALVRTSPGLSVGGYTVQVTGKGEASGMVIAEMYDAAAATRTAATPRLINVSTRAQIDNNSDLTVGFVLGGQSARTVLVRGVGPSLVAFGVPGRMEDPQLELFDNQTKQRIDANDDWGGNADVATVSTSVGAFTLSGPTSKDAVVLVTLPPGQYSARIRGANGAGGAALVEVYEVE